MGVEHAFIAEVRNRPDFETSESYEVNGVDIEVPTKAPGKTSWQRRVLADLVPEYPVADAAEKVLYDIERLLTDPDSSDKTVPEALSGQFEALTPLYYAQLTGSTTIPVAFHVTAVKTPERFKCRTLKEQTLLLLCRDEEGRLDEKLVRGFIERFRKGKNELNLAQRAFVEALFPNYDPEVHALPNLENHLNGAAPFLAEPGRVFRRDLRTILAIDVPPSEFFRISNLLIGLHFGLFQPRMALVLNRAMEDLYRELAEPDSVDLDELERIEAGVHPDSDFRGWLRVRVPQMGKSRRLSTNAPERESYRELERELAQLHFSLMLLNRIRRASASYLGSKGWDEDAINEAVQFPSQLVSRLRHETEFRDFLEKSLTTLALRFVVEQLNDDLEKDGIEAIESAASGADALKKVYIMHNAQPPARPWKTRAVKSGIQVTDGVLRRGENGIINSRNRVGKYFELGVGLLPLLLLLVIGSDRPKISVHEWWEGLREYGFDFSDEDKEILLNRLRSMGLYERFSDAGAANYIHNLMTGGTSS